MIGTAGILAVGVGTSGASVSTTKITCHVSLTMQGAPGVTGQDYGTINCPGPFGQGVQHDTFMLTPATQTTGTAMLKFKAYFNTGTVSGVWRASYKFTSSTTGDFTDKVIKWTSGTGAFKNVRGSGTGSGTLTGAHSLDTLHVTLTSR